MRISLLGEPYSFHHVAATQYWGIDTDILFLDDFDEVIKAVQNGLADHCIIAVENTVAGEVPGNYKRVVNSGLHIEGEINLHLAMHLAAKQVVPVETLHAVISHPMALKETAAFFLNYPSIKRISASSTSAAVKTVAESDDEGMAAIGNTSAIRFYNLQIIVKNIDNLPNNITRFLILSKQYGNPDATSSPVKASVKLLSASPALPVSIGLRRDFDDRITYVELPEGPLALILEQIDRLRAAAEDVTLLGVYPTGETASGS
ncbi:MAG TPA: prephenate dehydratase domain-containing protein [Chitinophagales bacterium]|nr:prephenate dehydratase domain-containing protein [Chitinophagales bacterium]